MQSLLLYAFSSPAFLNLECLHLVLRPVVMRAHRGNRGRTTVAYWALRERLMSSLQISKLEVPCFLGDQSRESVIEDGGQWMGIAIVTSSEKRRSKCRQTEATGAS